jgi:hypothetical protein
MVLDNNAVIGLQDFVNLVEKMRNAQKRYFRNRQNADLEESKRLERMIDNYISEAKKPVETQTSLF